MASFTRFIYLCANGAGQFLNRDELARNTGVDNKTILSWLGLLDNSYITFQLQPWFNNGNKRIIKSPKLYFTDTGLLCFLLGINNKTALRKHPLYGFIFENWIIGEVRKNRLNAGITDNLYFLRDSGGNEIDLIFQKNDELFGVEIKATNKIDSSVIKGLNYWHKNQPKANALLVYGGKESYELNPAQHALSWKHINDL